LLGFISRRLTFSIITLLVVVFAVYAIFSLLPFDPAALTCGQHCNPQIIHSNRIRLGYDKSLLAQFWLFIKGIFLGRTYGFGASAFTCPAPSFGFSFNQNECVSTLLAQAFPITINLAIGSLIIWLIMGVGLGILAARYKGKFLDTASSIFVHIILSRFISSPMTRRTEGGGLGRTDHAGGCQPAPSRVSRVSTRLA